MDAIVSNGFVMESDQLIQKTKVFFKTLCRPKVGILGGGFTQWQILVGKYIMPNVLLMLFVHPKDTCANQKGKDYCKQATSLNFFWLWKTTG